MGFTNPKILGTVPIGGQLGHDALAGRWRRFISRDGCQKRKKGTDPSPSAKDGEVNHGVGLFTEPIYFCWFRESEVAGNRPGDTGSEGLADKGPEDDIVGDEDEVPPRLCVARVGVGGSRDASSDKEEVCKGIWHGRREEWSEEFPVREEDDGDEEEFECRGWRECEWGGWGSRGGGTDLAGLPSG